MLCFTSGEVMLTQIFSVAAKLCDLVHVMSYFCPTHPLTFLKVGKI